MEKNVNKFYVISNFLEKWFFNNRGREWDSKRNEIQNLINYHFGPVYKENTNYLYPIVLVIVLIILLGIGTIIYNKNDDYEFKTISSKLG